MLSRHHQDHSSSKKVDVLIIGAGPAGLVLGCLLERYEISYLIIDQEKKPSGKSKATGIHRNSMRLLDEIGLAEEVMGSAILLNGVAHYVNGTLVQTTTFSQGEQSVDKNITINQDEFERVLLDKVRSNVLEEHVLVNFNMKENCVYTVVCGSETKFITSHFIIGADGAKSRVRLLLDIKFEGEVTPDEAFTFDAKITTPLQENIMFMHTMGEKRLVIVPLPGDMHKFSGKILGDDVTATNLPTIVSERARIAIDPDTITGFSTYHTQSKTASTFGIGRALLIGDAAHTFLPAGGYGLNMGIEDAFGVGWRLRYAKSMPIYNQPTFIRVTFCEERTSDICQFQSDAKLKKAESECTEKLGSNGCTSEQQAYSLGNSPSSFFGRMSDKTYNRYKNGELKLRRTIVGFGRIFERPGKSPIFVRDDLRIKKSDGELKVEKAFSKYFDTESCTVRFSNHAAFGD